MSHKTMKQRASHQAICNNERRQVVPLDQMYLDQGESWLEWTTLDKDDVLDVVHEYMTEVHSFNLLTMPRD